jgi:cell division protein FtsB
MSSVRGRRGASPADGGRSLVRHTGRVHTTRPVRARTSSGPARAPGQRRSARRPARAFATARRRPLVTGRAVLLGALVLLLALTLAGPVRQYLAGRAELVQLAAEGRQLEQRARDLEAELERQADPAWVQREARERLTYVLPGDRLVVVVDGRAVAGEADDPASGGPVRPPLPWYEGLMESVAVADGDVADGDAPAEDPEG